MIELPKLSIPPARYHVSWGDSMLLIGSCFSDELAPYVEQSGFACMSNPFGTIFHPEAIANALLLALGEQANDSIYQRDDLYFSWFASGVLFGYNRAEFLRAMEQRSHQVLVQLRTAKQLVVTFGTSWGYRLTDTDQLVANCHKAPQGMFRKELTAVEKLVVLWGSVISKIRAMNPDVEFVFTVSPVRHIRDGWAENNRSKGRLHELVAHLVEKFDVGYFPSYELVLDQLRDYRYFKEDGVHPNDLAVRWVWKHYSEIFWSAETQQYVADWQRLRQSCLHQSLYPESRATREFIQQVAKRLDQFIHRHPNLVVDAEIKNWMSENASDK